jgi:hypothetical protein
MAEIKSTLDLVLEKTKNLAMTAEEKERFKRREWEEHLRAWALKFINGLTDLKSFKKEVDRFRKGQNDEIRKFLKDRVTEQIRPWEDNKKAYQIMEKILGIKKDPYLEASRAFQSRLASRQADFLERERLRLEELGISGSAVEPDISRDAEWRLFYEQAVADFRDQISRFPDN